MAAIVLIVDDEIHIRRLTAQMLELAGYQVMQAASGSQALSLIEETKKRFSFPYRDRRVDSYQDLLKLYLD